MGTILLRGRRHVSSMTFGPILGQTPFRPRTRSAAGGGWWWRVWRCAGALGAFGGTLWGVRWHAVGRSVARCGGVRTHARSAHKVWQQGLRKVLRNVLWKLPRKSGTFSQRSAQGLSGPRESKQKSATFFAEKSCRFGLLYIFDLPQILKF